MSIARFGRCAVVSIVVAAACSAEPPRGADDSTAGGPVAALAAHHQSLRTTSLTVDDALSRAKSGVGFSYWWGGGCWSPGASQKGSCTGSCPSCSHSGSWGADCSGFVAKAWEVPTATAVSSCGHPYSTDTFYNEEKQWTTVPRSSARRGDAFVYRQSGAGHIFLVDSGDPWGWIKAYEAKGCATGIVYDSRTASSAYKVIRRSGF